MGSLIVITRIIHRNVPARRVALAIVRIFHFYGIGGGSGKGSSGITVGIVCIVRAADVPRIRHGVGSAAGGGSGKRYGARSAASRRAGGSDGQRWRGEAVRAAGKVGNSGYTYSRAESVCINSLTAVNRKWFCTAQGISAAGIHGGIRRVVAAVGAPVEFTGGIAQLGGNSCAGIGRNIKAARIAGNRLYAAGGSCRPADFSFFKCTRRSTGNG